jgi:UDP-N-acetylmuramoyl-L-alanyl-D-glutamate--2,6-diaminopimelate ligase
MGAAAIETADMVVITSDNPRTEKPSDIVDQVLTGIPKDRRDQVVVQVDRARAIRYAIEEATAGDVVVIAGKGHENEQVIAAGNGETIRVHFDDCEIAETSLAERRG